MGPPADAEAITRALRATPVRLTRLSRGVGDDALAARPSANEWSAREIVGHLRANADVWGPSIQRMLGEISQDGAEWEDDIHITYRRT